MDGPFYVDTLLPHSAVSDNSVTLSTSLQVMCSLWRLPRFPPNYFSYPGKAVRITIHGQATSGATPGGFNWGIYWGAGTAGLGTLVNGVNVTWTANATAQAFLYKGVIRCRTTGASGSLMAIGTLLLNSTGMIPCPASANAAVTGLDLTQNYYLFPQLSRSGSTAESAQVHDIVFESLN